MTTKQLHIARGLSFPLEAVTETFGILARKGRGKTYTASVMAEEMLKNGQQIVVIDPMGAWWGLRTKYPVLIFGGEHGDLKLSPQSGALLAELAVNKGVSMILDFSKFESKAEEIRFVTDFATKLYRDNRRPLHLFLDEADYFAPESSMKQRDESRMLGAFINIARRGRIRGLGLTVITQRAASVSKNVLTQIGVLIAMGVTSPQDRKAMMEWVKAHDVEHEADEMLRSLASLPVGEAWVWWPDRDIFQKTKIRKRETFDSSATPKVGQRVSAPKNLQAVDLERLRDQLESLIEEEEANDPTLLKRRIAELERKLSQAPATKDVAVEVKVPILDAGLVNKLERQIQTMQTAGTQMILKGEDMKSTANELKSSLEAAKGNVAAFRRGSAGTPAIQPAPRSEGGLARTPNKTPADPQQSDIIMPAAPRRMVAVLREHPDGLTPAQLAGLAGIALRKSTFRNGMSSLRKYDLIEERGGLISLSPAGAEFAGGIDDTPKSPEEIQQQWMNRLVAAPRRMLEVLIDHHPSFLPKELLAEYADVDYEASTFRNGLSQLRKHSLITEGDGMVRAADFLMGVSA